MKKFLLIFAALFLFAVFKLEIRIDLLFSGRGFGNLIDILVAFFPPKIDDFFLLSDAVFDTFLIATAGMFLSSLVSVPLGILASRNIYLTRWKKSVICYPVRWGLNTLRGIDTLIWALIFLAIFGFGETAGIFAIFFHTSGTYGKLVSESLEETNLVPIRALELIGASKTKAIFWGVLPTLKGNAFSTLLYLWEYNFRASQILGIVGAGGIGMQINNAMALYDWKRVAGYLIMIVVVVTIFDMISGYVRRRIRV